MDQKEKIGRAIDKRKIRTEASTSFSEGDNAVKTPGDQLYEILRGRLSAVANEIIAEIELSEDMDSDV